MKLAFHYHIPFLKKEDGTIYTTSFLGVFIDSLAEKCDELTIIYYSPLASELEQMNYVLKRKNIKCFHLGVHESVPIRLVKLIPQINKLNRILNENEFLLLRAPTPLSLIFPCLKNKNKIIFYLVGDYVQGAVNLKFGIIKNNLIKLLSYAVEFVQKRAIKGRPYFANSQLILDNNHHISTKGYLIKTTTLSVEDFYDKKFEYKQPIKILFTGRIDESKGVFEILKACSILKQENIIAEFHIAGLLVKGKESITQELSQLSISLGIQNQFIYHGLKKIGPELNQLYRNCDIYVIASKSDFEGFPRTLWEAMANSLPIITTTVGSIPFFLKDGKTAFFLDKSNETSIASAIKKIIFTNGLSDSVTQNAMILAKENTLDIQSYNLLEKLNEIKNGSNI